MARRWIKVDTKQQEGEDTLHLHGYVCVDTTDESFDALVREGSDCYIADSAEVVDLGQLDMLNAVLDQNGGIGVTTMPLAGV